MKTCPLLSVCGGCSFDFSASDYRVKKQELIANWNLTRMPIWISPGARRRADFCFADGVFGFYQRGTKNIVPVINCPNMVPEINAILPDVAKLPWNGAGAVLITLCENGLDLAVTSNVPYYSREFKAAVEKLKLCRVTWNGAVVCQTAVPQIKFGDVLVDYPSGAFLQPTIPGADAMREFVVKNTLGAGRVVDLFCGIGNFTYALDADGFDVMGPFTNRDLFKRPLTQKMLNKYDVVVMDPPRAGADAQCRELAKSDVKRIIYISCNPASLRRDATTLTRAGYKITDIVAFDQFVGTEHWELGAVFDR